MHSMNLIKHPIVTISPPEYSFLFFLNLISHEIAIICFKNVFLNLLEARKEIFIKKYFLVFIRISLAFKNKMAFQL